MGRILDMFGRSSLGRLLVQAQRKLAAEDFDEAQKLVAKGLLLYPDAEPLRELEMTIRRAQARAGIQNLKARIERDEDPRAYEQLISLYLELGLFAEARTESLAYANAHPDRDAAHLLLGEMSLQAFFEGLQARDAHVAQLRLTRASRLNERAIKPLLLLAELYYCVGANRALHSVAGELQTVAGGDPMIEPVLRRAEKAAKASGPESLDGIFEGIELEGALRHEPTTWPLRSKRRRVRRLDEGRAQMVADLLVARGSPVEVAMLQPGGAVLAHSRTPTEDDDTPHAEREGGLVDVTRTVIRTIKHHARDVDLGSFRRCTIQGPFGVLTVGEVGGTLTGARWPANPEPLRLWERVALKVEDSLGGK